MKRELQRKILGWINIGPMGSIEGREEEIRATVDALGEEAVSVVLDVLIEAEAGEDEEFLDSAEEFADMYAARFPQVMAKAGVGRLSPEGPASIVSVLGSTGERGLVPRLLGVIDTRRASAGVLIALVDCLGELGGEVARVALEELRGRGDLELEVVEEIGVVLQLMEM